MIKYKSAITITVIAIVSAIAGYFVGYLTNKPSKAIDEYPGTIVQEDMKEIRGGGYEFINPLLECDNYKPSKLNSLIKMEGDLNTFVNQSLSSGTSSHISVYFRALSSGPWIGIREDENYSPASLLKVPIMIAVLKKADNDRTLLEKKVNYKELLDKNYVPNIKDTNLIKLGNTYSVLQLIEYMIVHSDNEAKELLLQLMDDAFIINVMKETGVDIRHSDLSKDFISVRQYSSFFRILYNATYLSRDMSELALSILSKSTFETGLPASLPRGIKVAHKFGERGFQDSNIKQLHDCGIVYYNGSPYLLCVMTKGSDFGKLTDVIKGISTIVFENVKSNRVL